MSNEAYVKLNKNLTFLSDSIYNATVVDGSTNQVLYQISTPNKMGKHSTTVANADGVVVAEFVRHWGVNKDEVVLHGQTMKVHEWLPSKSSHVCSRHWTAPNGKLYHWKSRKAASALKLVEVVTDRTVAKAHNAFHVINSRKMTVEFEPEFEEELIPHLDALVIAFIICEEKRREMETPVVS